MAIFKTHKQDIRQIFEFASGENPFDCIDVQSNTKDFDLFAFLTAPGSYVYRTRLIVDDNKAALLGVMGLRIEFFDADAEKFNVTDNNLLGQHDITFDTQSIAVKNIASINKNMKITADVFADSAMKVYAANIKATSNLDKITLPKSAGSPQAKSLKEAKIPHCLAVEDIRTPRQLSRHLLLIQKTIQLLLHFQTTELLMNQQVKK